MKTAKYFLFALLLSIVLAQGSWASSLGILYEQQYDESNTTIPTISIGGSSSVQSTQSLSLIQATVVPVGVFSKS